MRLCAGRTAKLPGSALQQPQRYRQPGRRTTCTASSSSSSSSSSSNDSRAVDAGALRLMAELSAAMGSLSEADAAAAAAAAVRAIEQRPDIDELLQQKQARRQQQPQTAPTAEAFLTRVLQKAAEGAAAAAGGSEGGAAAAAAAAADPMQFLRSTEGRRLLFDVAKEQFTAEEARLLDVAFGSDWSRVTTSGSSSQFDAAALMRLASLEGDDLGRLGGVMGKLTALSKQMEGLAVRSAAAAAAAAPDTPQQQQPKRQQRSWGASFLRAPPGAATAGQATAPTTANQHQQFSWDAPLSGSSTSQRLQRLLVLMESTVAAQQQQWGVPASQQFVMLLRLCQQLVQLAAAEQLLVLQQAQPPDASAAEAAALLQRHGVPALSADAIDSVLAQVNTELNWLVRHVSEQDTATRSSLWYMQALMGDPSWQEPQEEPQVSRLEQLGLFLAAASNLEGLRVWADALLQARPWMAETPELQEVLSLLDDDWFILPSERANALAAAEAAAAAAAASEALAGALGSSGGVAEAPAFGLARHMIDATRIVQLASIQPAGVLWFLAEMEAAPDASRVLLKWALHPTIGKLAVSGKDWLPALGLGPPLQGVYNRMRVASMLAQL